MRQTGLLSVTFRTLSAEKIIELASQAGLDGLEWGGDVHVLPGDWKRAETIGRETKKAGLVNFAYGSYWRADREPEMIAETAGALGAQWIRVWAGILPSSDHTVETRRRTVGYLKELCRRVPRGMQVAAEWHCNTLTDNADSALRLLDEVGEDNFFCYFQREERPDPRQDNLRDLLRLSPDRIRAVHVHYNVGRERMPLADGRDEWAGLLAHLPERIPALLEFVRNDSAEQFLEDARILKKLAGRA